MQLWTQWLELIRMLLHFLSTDIGLGGGLGILVLTFLLRATLLPLSWFIAYRGIVRQEQMARLQPELLRLKTRFAAEPQRYAEQMRALYREHGLSIMDGRSLLGSLAQMPILVGMYQVLRDGISGVRFLWVQSLSRPDLWLALLAGFTTILMMAANPDLPESTRLLMILVPSVLAVLFALKVSSALAVYWTASNSFSAVQTVALHRVIARRVRLGLLKV
jgi:YidC/Oxa1 family membrane protein insertase